MLKSVIASVLCAAVAVAAWKEKHECTPLYSGQLQMWAFNLTEAPIALGVNATKSGEYVTPANVKEPLDVVFEDCLYYRRASNYTVETPYRRLSLDKQGDLCVSHRTDKSKGKLYLERCADDVDGAREKQHFELYYGVSMKGQNATLYANSRSKQDGYVYPFVAVLQETNKEIAEMTAEGFFTRALQIGNPKAHNAHK